MFINAAGRTTIETFWVCCLPYELCLVLCAVGQPEDPADSKHGTLKSVLAEAGGHLLSDGKIGAKISKMIVHINMGIDVIPNMLLEP